MCTCFDCYCCCFFFWFIFMNGWANKSVHLQIDNSQCMLFSTLYSWTCSRFPKSERIETETWNFNCRLGLFYFPFYFLLPITMRRWMGNFSYNKSFCFVLFVDKMHSSIPDWNVEIVSINIISSWTDLTVRNSNKSVLLILLLLLCYVTTAKRIIIISFLTYFLHILQAHNGIYCFHQTE